MTTPTFTTLLDWVDGRLDEVAAAAVARHVASSREAAEAVDWIRSFRDAGRAMPLVTPPEDVRRDLRAAFRRHAVGSSHDSARDADHEADVHTGGRRYGVVAGTRSAHTADVGHLTIEGGGLTLTLTLVGAVESSVDVVGHLTWDGSSPRPEVVLSAPDATLRRVARPDADGHFRLDQVSRTVDEVWILSPTASVRAGVDLGPEA